jgi:hypothetical protein
MSIFPKIKPCPACGSLNLIKTNSIAYENNFKSLGDWVLKKIFNCRKCKIELGLFFHKKLENKNKLIWTDFIKCEENYYNVLQRLQVNKIKYQKNKEKYYKILDEIRAIQNEIHLTQIKLKIKHKIQHRGMHVV